MKLLRISCTIGLVAAAFGFAACKDDDDDDDPVGGKAPQDQIYLNNVTPDKPLLVVYGDSISTGVLANTKLGENLPPTVLVQLGSYIKSGQYNPANFQSNLANQDLAAATTANDYGLREGIAAKTGVTPEEVGVVSLAKFGGKAVDIPEMIARWNQEEANTIHRKPNYILVALGGNDFCSDMTVELITQTFSQQIEKVRQTAPDATMIISPAPPVYQLAAIDHEYGPTTNAVAGENLSCRKFREQACKRVYDPDAQARLDGINQGIQAAYEEQKAKGANVVFASSMLDWKIAADELAFDCFHPSQQGQATIGSYYNQAIPQ